MKRRQFLSSAVAGGLAFAGSTWVRAASPPASGGAPARKLTPPEKGLVSVACAISQGTTEIDWVGPEAVFETWHRDAAGKPAPRFKIFTVSETLSPVDGRVADFTFESAPAANVIVVPAQTGSPALLEWLQKRVASCDVLMSVCVGARHLAKAGLLDGREATSHHGAIDRLQSEFPKVRWVRGVRFVEGDRISTGGGLTAGIDLALRVVERYFGRESARMVAEHLEYQSSGWIV
jgi:transcriptional regulator GlxA family with amidase domain